MRLALVFVLCWVLASCRNPAALALGVKDGTVERYRLSGVVVRCDPGRRTITIKHGPIANDTGKVWMEAMTMEFPVLKGSDSPPIKPGVSISAEVLVRASDREYWIEQVQLRN